MRTRLGLFFEQNLNYYVLLFMNDNILKYEDQEYLLEHCLGNEFDHFMLVRSQVINSLQELVDWADEELFKIEMERYSSERWGWDPESLEDLSTECDMLVHNFACDGNCLDLTISSVMIDADPHLSDLFDEYLTYIHKAVSFIESQKQQRFDANQFFGVYLDD